jgi:hypothetical protein
MVQGRLDVGQQRAIAFDQVRTDSLDLVAQMLVAGGREFGSRFMQRHHVRAAAVTVSLDQAKFGAAQRGMNVGALESEAGIRDGGGERVEGFEEMNVRIPERVVGVEDQIEGSVSSSHLDIA